MVKKIVTIDLDQYGGTGTWTGTPTQLPASGFSNKQYTKGSKKIGRVKPAKGGYLGKKIRKPQKKKEKNITRKNSKGI